MSSGAYLVGEESVEHVCFGTRGFLPGANSVPIAPDEFAKRDVLQSLWVSRQFMSVGLALDVARPLKGILPKREGFGHRSYTGTPNLDLPFLSMLANSRHRTSSCDHSVTS